MNPHVTIATDGSREVNLNAVVREHWGTVKRIAEMRFLHADSPEVAIDRLAVKLSAATIIGTVDMALEDRDDG